MNWIFRKIFQVGPFRGTLSKKGVGVSWGIPGFRLGVSATGSKYITIGIPGTGLYFTNFFNSKGTQPIPKHTNHPKQPNQPPQEPWWKQKHLRN